jgi:DNA-binding transcriptional ArsR family regulator
MISKKSLPSHEPPDLAAIDVVTVLHALADPVRLEIVRQLADCQCSGPGELSCGQIEVPVGKSTASHHLKTLSGAGITTEREAGTRKYIRLRREELDRHFPGLVESVLRSPSAARD